MAGRPIAVCNQDHPDKLCDKRCRRKKGHGGDHKWWNRSGMEISWPNEADKDLRATDEAKDAA